MPDTTETVVNAYLTGQASREQARERLRATVAEGRTGSLNLEALSPGQRRDVVTLLNEVTDDLVGSGHQPRRHWQPPGYRLIAFLILFKSLSDVWGALTPSPFPQDVAGIVNPWQLQVGTVLTATVGLTAAWAIWTRRRSAAEFYLGWAVLCLGTLVYEVVAPPTLVVTIGTNGPAHPIGLHGVWWPVALSVVLYSSGYGYLVWRRPPAV
jgi:hypothetical protein